MYAFVLMSYFSKSYASIDSKLYNYNFGRGITGSRSIKLDRFYKISTQMHIIEQLYKFVDTQHAEDYSHYCDVLKLRGKIFFNEVYANFTYVEDFDSNQDAALGHFLDGLTPVEDEAFENPEIEANYLNALFSYVDELYYNKNVENTKKIFDWATDIVLQNKECSIDSMIVKEVNRLMPVLETEKKVIPVVFATNDNYAPYLGATLSSLIAHASDDYVYDVYVFHTSLSELNLFRLTSMSTENVCVRTVNVLPYVKNMRNYSHSHYSVEMYYRILIPEILSQYEKAVYLDCDLILKDDVANLYNVELSDNILAAVINDIVSANMKKYL
jgi:hypothetical protein